MTVCRQISLKLRLWMMPCRIIYEIYSVQTHFSGHISRHIMTCCVEDIQFGGLVAKYAGAKGLTHGEWVIITAEVKNEYNHMYQGNGPVLHVTDLEKTDVPEQEVATFY